MPADKKNAGAAANGPAAEAKEEAELKASLGRLDNLQGQLEEMRVAMQKMLHPLHATAAEPEVVYATFADSAQKVVQDIKEFQAAMRDEKMQELLKKGKEWSIKQENGNGWHGNVNGALESWQVEEDTGAAVNGLDALKIERQDTPKKG